MHNGRLDDDVHIDHIDGNTLNNKLENLRTVDRGTNNRNAARRSDNTSGVCGVSWCNRDKRWVATICKDGKRFTLGRFYSLDDAARVRREAEPSYGYTSRHGR